MRFTTIASVFALLFVLLALFSQESDAGHIKRIKLARKIAKVLYKGSKHGKVLLALPVPLPLPLPLPLPMPVPIIKKFALPSFLPSLLPALSALSAPAASGWSEPAQYTGWAAPIAKSNAWPIAPQTYDASWNAAPAWPVSSYQAPAAWGTGSSSGSAEPASYTGDYTSNAGAGQLQQEQEPVSQKTSVSSGY